jgi:hypothetical protein
LLVGEIRSSLDSFKREDLVEVLTYVFKEYVVEGASVLPAGAGAVLDAKTELEGMSFAQLITWLQRHFDLPELQLFEVAGATVSVRAGGRAVPLEPPRAESPLASMPPPRPAAAPAPPPQAAPSVSLEPLPSNNIVNTAHGPVPAPTTRPAAPAPTPAPPTPGATPQQQQQRTEETTDSDSRFSRLEVD